MQPGEAAAPHSLDDAVGALQQLGWNGQSKFARGLEVDDQLALRVGMVVMASGAFTIVESIELITMGQMMEAMKSAGPVAAKFRPPGK